MVPKTHIGAVGAFLKLLGKKKKILVGFFSLLGEETIGGNFLSFSDKLPVCLFGSVE